MRDSGQFSYWWGPDTVDRRITYAEAFRPEFQVNGDNLVARYRAAINYVCGQGGFDLPNEEWASGWRSPSVNEATSNAAKLSTHLTAEGGDRKDSVDGDLCWALLQDPGVLETHGLYIEHPVGTLLRSWERAYQKGKASGKAERPWPWCHAQTRPPASHQRAYWPDRKAEPEWRVFVELGGYVGITFADWLVLRQEAEPKIRETTT